MARKGETLEEGLNREANKKGLSGKERHRYIGGAITNIKKKKGKLASRPKAEPKPKAAPRAQKPKAPTKPKAPAEKITLSVKKNTAASKNRAYDVYSIYKADGTMYTDATYRKRSIAVREAAVEEDAYNQGYKRKKFA